MTKLITCPHCNKMPSISRYILGDLPAYDLCCIYPKCPVKPVMRAYRCKEQLLKDWGTRPRYDALWKEYLKDNGITA